jgi:uncharacterized ferritin-like protein (DUF455 family)
MELRQCALDAFCLSDPQQKVEAVHFLWQQRSTLVLEFNAQLPAPCGPGRPERPQLVDPKKVARRSAHTAQGHAALVHSIAHIEFNAINLALDAVWRFAGMPAAYYEDWLRVADEEAKHFSMLQTHLASQGYGYGDFAAHEGLWTMCSNTQHSIVARMALVPRTLEARGLDATPIIQSKLRQVGTAVALEFAHLLDTILADEVGHVRVGNRWYHWLCERDQLDPVQFYAELAALHGAPRLKPPLNVLARRAAGFSEAEIQNLLA